jgi:hypothetical protein
MRPFSKKKRLPTPPLNVLRSAISARHGGFETASERELLDFWRTLDESRKAEYLKESAEGDPEGMPSASAKEESAKEREDALRTPYSELRTVLPDVTPAGLREGEMYGLDLADPAMVSQIPDRNANGKITRDEVREYAKRNNLPLVGEK